jgi:hypothetical protein
MTGPNMLGPYKGTYVPQGMPAPHPEQASVFYYRGGETAVLWPEGFRDGPRFRLPRRPRSVVDVVLGRHRTDFDMQLPALSGAAFFTARVRVLWEVVDPVRVAQTQLRNVAEQVEPELSQVLREVTLRYPVDAAGEATRAVRGVLAGLHPPIGARFGLRTEVYVELDVDEAVVAEYAKFRQRKANKQRMAEFMAMVEQGNYAQAALLVGQDENNMAAALEMIRKDEQASNAQKADYLRMLLEHGVIKPHHLDRSDWAAINAYLNSGGRPLPTGDPLAITGGPPQPPRPELPVQADRDGRAEPAPAPGAPVPDRSHAPARRPAAGSGSRTRDEAPHRPSGTNDRSQRSGPAWADPDQTAGTGRDPGRNEDSGRDDEWDASHRRSGRDGRVEGAGGGAQDDRDRHDSRSGDPHPAADDGWDSREDRDSRDSWDSREDRDSRDGWGSRDGRAEDGWDSRDGRAHDGWAYDGWDSQVGRDYRDARSEDGRDSRGGRAHDGRDERDVWDAGGGTEVRNGRHEDDGWDAYDDGERDSRQDAGDGWDAYDGGQDTRAGRDGGYGRDGDSGRDGGWDDDESWHAPARRLDRPEDDDIRAERGRRGDTWDDWGRDR